MDQAIAEFFFEIFLLPFRIFWWAIKHDLGLLEDSPVSSKKSQSSQHHPPSPTVWDQDLDGPNSE